MRLEGRLGMEHACRRRGFTPLVHAEGRGGGWGRSLLKQLTYSPASPSGTTLSTTARRPPPRKRAPPRTSAICVRRESGRSAMASAGRLRRRRYSSLAAVAAPRVTPLWREVWRRAAATSGGVVSYGGGGIEQRYGQKAKVVCWLARASGTPPLARLQRDQLDQAAQTGAFGVDCARGIGSSMCAELETDKLLLTGSLPARFWQ